MNTIVPQSIPGPEWKLSNIDSGVESADEDSEVDYADIGLNCVSEFVQQKPRPWIFHRVPSLPDEHGFLAPRLLRAFLSRRPLMTAEDKDILRIKVLRDEVSHPRVALQRPVHVMSAIKELKEELKELYAVSAIPPWKPPVPKVEQLVPEVEQLAREEVPKVQEYIPDSNSNNNNALLVLGFDEPVNPDVDLQWMKNDNLIRYARFAEAVLHGRFVSEGHIKKIEGFVENGTPYKKPRIHGCFTEYLSLKLIWDYDDAVSDISSVTCDTYVDAEEYLRLPDL